LTVISFSTTAIKTNAARKRIAIVGSGISGSSAAWALAASNDVTIFEANTKPGGHTATVDIDYDGTPVAVDTGFIVYNEHNYPNLTALFAYLDVKTSASNMGFALSLDEGKLEWSGASFTSLFAQRRNIVSLSFLNMLREILRFNKMCVVDRNSGYTAKLSIGDYLKNRQFSLRFIDDYLIPMAAAIWSTPRLKMLDFPADAFISFFENHRLIHNERPNWRTVVGGSRNYLDKLLSTPGVAIRCNNAVSKVHRLNGKVYVSLASGDTEVFDAVIMACHSDQALGLLCDSSPQELQVLGAIKYRPNRVVLHRDASLMPKRKRAWSAWNYLRSSKIGAKPEVAVTYWMNCLQGIDNKMPLFITLNPPHEPKLGSVFGEWSYDHPQFDAQAIEAQALLSQIQGRGSVWFAGAWTGYGFHEDGLRSGLEVAVELGAKLPFPLAQSRITRALAAAE
jgi:uncharacterized protein